MSRNFSKFDSEVACEETHDFVPTPSELAASLPLWDDGAPRRKASERNAILRDEADIRGEAYLMAN